MEYCMTYQVLARKWRPKVFNDIVGQEHILLAIKNSFILNKIHHAYILSGMRGIGKTTIARLFAKILNCTCKSKYDVCGCCPICLEIEKGCFFDVIEIDAASRTKIEDTREFLEDVNYSPSISKFKIYLIDEVHMLSRNSLNALLKTLEEPPKNVKFFLITTDHKKLPATVISRCIQFHLHPLSSLQVFEKLTYIFKKENIEFESRAIRLISDFSQGSMRDALNLSEQAIILGKNKISHTIVQEILGLIDTDHSLFLLEKIIHSDLNAIMCRINKCQELDVNWNYLLSDMLSLLHKIAIMKISHAENTNIDCNHYTIVEISKLSVLSNQVTSSNIQLYYHILLAGKKELPYAPSYRMGFEMIMIRASMLLYFPTNSNCSCLINQNNLKTSQNINQNVDLTNIITNQGSFISTF